MTSKQNDGDDFEGHDFSAHEEISGGHGEWGEETPEPVNDFGEETPVDQEHAHEDPEFNEMGHEVGYEEESSAPAAESRPRGGAFSRGNLIFYGGGVLLAVVVLGIAYSQFASHGANGGNGMNHPPVFLAKSPTTHTAPRPEQVTEASKPKESAQPGGTTPQEFAGKTMSPAQEHGEPMAMASASSQAPVTPTENRAAPLPQNAPPAGIVESPALMAQSPTMPSLPEAPAASVKTSAPTTASPSMAISPLTAPLAAAPEGLAPAAMAETPLPRAPRQEQEATVSVSSAPSQTSTASAADNGSQAGDRIADMAAQISRLTARLDQMAATPQSASGSGSAASAQMIEALEKEVTELRSQVAALQGEQGESRHPIVAEAMSAPEEPVVPVSHAHKTTARAHAALRHAKASSPVHKKRKTASATRAHWVLRSATPGVAWISSSKTSDDLKRVVPGDSVLGIGRVKAVRQDGSHWVVEGTDGTIR